jgi:DNA-directed RNA polymerase specialized sigma24 family protein
MSDEQNILGGGGAPGRGDGAAALRGMSEGELLDLINGLKVIAARRCFGPLNCEDLVMQALTDVLRGRRKGSWNSSFTPFENLCLIIRSIAGNQWDREKRAVPLDPDSAQFARPSHGDDYEAGESRRRISSAFDAAIRGDDFLRDVVALALDAGWKPRRIAEGLRVDVSKVYKAKRRIRRRLESLLVTR